MQTKQKVKPVREKFQIHPKMLLDVIRRQAGTLSKAILELVMNAIDAGANTCDIVLRSSREGGPIDIVEVRDNGRGFRSRTEIDKWFKVFGQPHEESENKVFGAFRLGRGQSFAFGRNVWRTSTFRMDVDVAKNGTEYDLLTDLDRVEGCSITSELYAPMNRSETLETETDLRQWCKWAPILITLNGETISRSVSAEKWDKVTPNAYLKLGSAEGLGLAVYNLGIHVVTFPSWRYGVSGTVVSKKQVKVNFARNDIQSDCPVWKSIREGIDEIAGRKLATKKVLNDSERQRVADRLLTGVTTSDIAMDMRIFTLVTGRHCSASELRDVLNRPMKFSSAPRGNRIGDRLHRSGAAFIFSEETLARFKVDSVHELFDSLRNTSMIGYGTPAIVSFSDLVKDYDMSYELVPSNKTTKREKVWLRLLGSAIANVRGLPHRVDRNVYIGLSDKALAWTDSATYVAFDRSYLAKTAFTPRGISNVLSTLLHECCHVTQSMEDHDHDQAFYEMFHDAAGCLGELQLLTMAKLPSIIKSLSPKSYTRHIARNEDKLIAGQVALNELEEARLEDGEVEA